MQNRVVVVFGPLRIWMYFIITKKGNLDLCQYFLFLIVHDHNWTHGFIFLLNWKLCTFIDTYHHLIPLVPLDNILIKYRFDLHVFIFRFVLDDYGFNLIQNIWFHTHIPFNRLRQVLAGANIKCVVEHKLRVVILCYSVELPNFSTLPWFERLFFPDPKLGKCPVIPRYNWNCFVHFVA